MVLIGILWHIYDETIFADVLKTWIELTIYPEIV